MRFSVLASGSGGNACYVETRHARVLIDAGLSCRALVRRLEAVGVKPEGLDALVVTHEHTDHIRGAGPLARRFNLPVYINPPTLKNALRGLGRLPRPVSFETGCSLRIKDLLIETFAKCHDAADPAGLVVCGEGRRLGLVTDLGRSTRLVEDRLRGCGALVLEFNHDPWMLEAGPYPWVLKQRIRGAEGHLSNEQAGALLAAVAHEDLRHVVLAHLSAVNNEPTKALREASRALTRCGNNGTRVDLGRQEAPVPMIEL